VGDACVDSGSFGGCTVPPGLVVAQEPIPMIAVIECPRCGRVEHDLDRDLTFTDDELRIEHLCPPTMLPIIEVK